MTKARVLFASLIGTTIEFFDFYIYGTAAVLVFPRLFFPASDPSTATLQSLATFALAFFARPVGSALFGHFGDRIGRKATLVAALLTMGLSTVAIGLLPTYATIGIAAPALLALCRFGQGLGLGGEWGGAVLLATENAPRGRESWYGMFPQLGAPLGFLCSTGIFIVLTTIMNDADFMTWGWRVPFLASAVLVFVGLWVRLSLTETPAFERAIAAQERVRVPILVVCREHTRTLVLATLAAITTFVVFYLMTVFTLAWGTTQLGFSRQEFLLLQMIGVLFLLVAIPVSAVAAGRLGRRAILVTSSIAAIVFGLAFAPLFSTNDPVTVTIFLAIGLGVMGWTYGTLGAALAELFPTAVRYTGASLTFNLAGIFGGSLAPYIATGLGSSYGIASVGYYLCAAATVTLIAQLLLGPALGTRAAPHGAATGGLSPASSSSSAIK
jgi:metabolite-proton symporter